MRVHLHFPEAGSLKGKRAQLNRVKAHLRERMGASVAEVAHHDLWQRSTLAVAFAEASPGRCEEAADRVRGAPGGGPPPAAARSPPTGSGPRSTRASGRPSAWSTVSAPGTN